METLYEGGGRRSMREYLFGDEVGKVERERERIFEIAISLLSV